jgi:hypothetical protein
MICKKCQLAGEYNSAANVAESPSGKKRLFKEAAKLHKQCRNSEVKPAKKKDPASDKTRLTTWCDCQHATGLALNAAMIRTASSEASASSNPRTGELRSENEGDTNAVTE